MDRQNHTVTEYATNRAYSLTVVSGERQYDSASRDDQNSTTLIASDIPPIPLGVIADTGMVILCRY